jgi:hypothetical protein
MSGPLSAAPLRRSDALTAGGMFLSVLAVYLLTGPGRIDMIDGQFRYEVTRSILDGAGFRLRDPALPRVSVGTDGHRYAFYGPGASLTALPLVALARLFGGDLNTQMFFFSLTSAFSVSAAVSAFYLFRRRLGGTPGGSALSAAILAFATPFWPLATTVFDQGQQGALLFIGIFLAWEATVRESSRWAVVAGLVAGSVVLFQEGLCLLLPFAGLVLFEGTRLGSVGSRKLSELLRVPELRTRYVPFALGAAVPFALWLLYNYARFGNPLDSGKSGIAGHPPLWGNPLSGLLGLLFSPGKSIFLFFPTAALGVLALYAWRRERPMLSAALGSVTLVQLAFSSCLTFWSSDWAWGPRYLMLLAPMLTLPLGMNDWASGLRRRVTVLVASFGLVVQLLGISVEHHRFFFERRLSAFFWYWRPEILWHESQWLARPAEALSVFTEALPESPVAFRPGPYAATLPTYCIFGGHPPTSNVWMRRFAVFYLPRPWPFWVPALPDALRPVDPLRASAMCLAIGCAGLLLLGLGWRGRRPE